MDDFGFPYSTHWRIVYSPPISVYKRIAQRWSSYQVVDMAQSVPPGDIATQLGTKVVIKKEEDDDVIVVHRCTTIQVTNTSSGPIGWTFKTTNMKRLGVDPADGVLDVGETAIIAVSADPFAYGVEDTIDLMVEWTRAPDRAAKQFRREWFQGDARVHKRILSFLPEN
ncbi:hypothetical protein PRIPAC_74566 [Pristionchus pacificus]|uniref:Major sperm protein n=1 Tax=Pristionchus pacificus TaxID=54126 RepID=A0A2A6CF73_PRIPA|nr:hypothetical protein PRIPAC_74566 [Pristionchus pacificus]|eukprot:PDM76766.1 MSP domain-containing protein [Pristionchus pacificus]